MQRAVRRGGREESKQKQKRIVHLNFEEEGKESNPFLYSSFSLFEEGFIPSQKSLTDPRIMRERLMLSVADAQSISSSSGRA